jgi:hypothetical protein
VQDLDNRSYLSNDGKSVTFLKTIVAWQDHKFHCEPHLLSEDNKILEGLLSGGSLSDIPTTYYIPDLNVIIQSSHKVATTSMRRFMECLTNQYKLSWIRYESYDDLLMKINRDNTPVYRLIREPVCRALSNINYQSRNIYREHGAHLNFDSVNPYTGIDPHSCPQVSTIMGSITQDIYDDILTLRADRVRSYIKSILNDNCTTEDYGSDLKALQDIMDLPDLTDSLLMYYYFRFHKIDTTLGHNHIDLYWSHINKVNVYENTKFLWVSETEHNVFETLAKELDLGVDWGELKFKQNKTPNVKIGGRLPTNVHTLSDDLKQRFYDAYAPEVQFLKGLDYINTDPVFYDRSV